MMFAVGVVNDHPVDFDEKVDFNPEMLAVRVGLVEVAEQKLVVGVHVAPELARSGQVLEAFGHTLLVANATIDLAVLDGMDRRLAGSIVGPDAGHRHFSFYGLFYCHLARLSGNVSSEGGGVAGE